MLTELRVPKPHAINVKVQVLCSNCVCDKFTIMGKPNIIYQCMDCGYPNLRKELILQEE